MGCGIVCHLSADALMHLFQLLAAEGHQTKEEELQQQQSWVLDRRIESIELLVALLLEGAAAVLLRVGHGLMMSSTLEFCSFVCPYYLLS